jgi:hypothetical protein
MADHCEEANNPRCDTQFGPPNQSKTHPAEQVFKTGIVAHWIKKWRSFRESRHSRRTSLPFMESHTMKGIRTMLRAADSQLIEARQNLEFSLMASLAQK